MLSLPHLIVIFIVALVVFGPQKLPELARTLAKIMNEVRKHTNELRGSFEEQMRELERESQVSEQRRLQAASLPQTVPAATTGVAADGDRLMGADSASEPAAPSPAGEFARDTNLAATDNTQTISGDTPIAGDTNISRETTASAETSAFAEPQKTSPESPKTSPESEVENERRLDGQSQPA